MIGDRQARARSRGCRHYRTIVNLKPENVDAWLTLEGRGVEELFALRDDKQQSYYELLKAARREHPATIWHGGGFQWRLDSVEIRAVRCRNVELRDFESCAWHCTPPRK